MHAYRGYRRQRGAGLGNILGALFRMAKPILRTGLRTVLPVAARFGARVLGDVAEGKNVKRSAKRHAKQAGWEAVGAVANKFRKSQGGRGKKRRSTAHIKPRRQTKRKRRKSLPPIDVFRDAF